MVDINSGGEKYGRSLELPPLLSPETAINWLGQNTYDDLIENMKRIQSEWLLQDTHTSIYQALNLLENSYGGEENGQNLAAQVFELAVAIEHKRAPELAQDLGWLNAERYEKPGLFVQLDSESEETVDLIRNIDIDKEIGYSDNGVSKLPTIHFPSLKLEYTSYRHIQLLHNSEEENKAESNDENYLSLPYSVVVLIIGNEGELLWRNWNYDKNGKTRKPTYPEFRPRV